MAQILINNIVTTYESVGEGPVLLLLHGWKDNLHTFDRLMPELSKFYRVVRLDLPGFGGTEVPTQAWHVADYVTFVDAFTQKLTLDVAFFVGHSFGGRVIIKGVATGQFSPKKIALIASAGIRERKSIRSFLIQLCTQMGKTLTAIPPFSLFRDAIRRKLYNMLGSDYLGAGALTETYVYVVREDLLELAKQIHVPTLLIWGDQDIATPLADGKLFATHMPNAHLEVLAGRSHFVHQEVPEVVSKLITTFFK